MRRPGHWPSPTALLLLRVALWNGRPAARSWRRVLATVDLDTVDPGSARLLPLAHRNVRALELEDPWAGRMRGIHRYWWAHNQLLTGLAERALLELGQAGVATIVLKGLPVGLSYYDDPGIRPMSDVDVLVRPDDVPRTLASLASVGWQPEQRVEERTLRLLHGVSLHNAGGQTLDLHWAIHEEDVRLGADDAAWAGARPLRVGQASTAMLAPAALLVHALAGGSKWAADPAATWLADATLIIRRGDADWDEFIDEVFRRRLVVRVRSCLAYLHVALGVDVPEHVTERLAGYQAPVFERFDHQVRTRGHARLGELPRYWLAWARTSPDAWRDVAGFSEYLVCRWGLTSPAELPGAAGRRAVARVTTGRPLKRGE